MAPSQKFRHLNAFFTDVIAASNFPRLSSMLSTVGACTLRPVVNAERTSSKRSINAFASEQFFDFVIVVYSAGRLDIDARPNQKLAFTRIAWRTPTLSDGVRGFNRVSVWCNHQAARSPAPARTSFSPAVRMIAAAFTWTLRSEEHTSELQSLRHLVCRLLLEKKKPTTR